MLNSVSAALLGLALAAPNTGLADNTLPNGFDYLSDIAPEIEQDIKYVGFDNFLGRPVAGYEAPRCILSTAAAKALKKAAQILAKENLNLRVFDCYRPKRAVADFVVWAQDPKPAPTKAYYFPRYSKIGLFQAGYIAKRSGHSRGCTVDLTLAHGMTVPPKKQRRKLPIFGLGPRANDYEKTRLRTKILPRCDSPRITQRHPLNGALDMGTDFDCFSPLSATKSQSISEQAQANRKHLTQVMAKAGFRNYSAEWWHFTLVKSPFRKRHFDFIVR